MSHRHQRLRLIRRMGGFPAADDPDLPAPVLRPHRGDEPGEWAVPDLAIRQVGDSPILDEADLPSLVLDQRHSQVFDPRDRPDVDCDHGPLLVGARGGRAKPAKRADSQDDG